MFLRWLARDFKVADPGINKPLKWKGNQVTCAENYWHVSIKDVFVRFSFFKKWRKLHESFSLFSAFLCHETDPAIVHFKN